MEFSKITKKYWEEKDWQDLNKVSSFADMRVIAERVLIRIPKPIAGVCGPIAETGGLGSLQDNLNAFNNIIIELQKKGLNIFDQMPFEEKIQEFKAKLSPEDFLKGLNDDFYAPIFKFRSGLISTYYFMPNWRTSKGASWEYEHIKKLGTKIVYL